MKHYYGKQWDHIDPLYGEKTHGFSLVCGFHCLVNLTELEQRSNTRKSDAFVPYSVCDHAAPQNPGDVCEFWIDGNWMITEFLGDDWWREAKELGYSKSNVHRRGLYGGHKHKGRTAPNKGMKRKYPYPKLKWINNGSRNRRIEAEEQIPIGWQTGRVTNNLIRNSNGTFKSKNP